MFVPRTLLKKIDEDSVANAGYAPKFSGEYEWFNFLETPQSLKAKGHG